MTDGERETIESQRQTQPAPERKRGGWKSHVCEFPSESGWCHNKIEASKGAVKEEQIDKSTNNSHMNLLVLGKADSFTGKSFDTCTQGEMIPLNTLYIFLLGNQLIIRNFAVAGEVIVSINCSNGKRLKQLQNFIQVLCSRAPNT